MTFSALRNNRALDVGQFLWLMQNFKFRAGQGLRPCQGFHGNRRGLSTPLFREIISGIIFSEALESIFHLTLFAAENFMPLINRSYYFVALYLFADTFGGGDAVPEPLLMDPYTKGSLRTP